MEARGPLVSPRGRGVGVGWSGQANTIPLSLQVAIDAGGVVGARISRTGVNATDLHAIHSQYVSPLVLALGDVQPDTEHISAVLFANTGTVAKFGRMAVQEGLEAANVKMIRVGFCYDHDPNASEPLSFSYDVAERPSDWGEPETWGEGMSMFHNPNALHPVQESLFPDIAHHRLEDGHVTATIPRFHPFISQTRTLLIRA